MLCGPAVAAGQPDCDTAFSHLLAALDRYGLLYGAALYQGDLSCVTMGEAQLSFTSRRVATLALEFPCDGQNGAIQPLRLNRPAPENEAQAQAVVKDCLKKFPRSRSEAQIQASTLDRTTAEGWIPRAGQAARTGRASIMAAAPSGPDPTYARPRGTPPDLSRAAEAGWCSHPLPPMPDKRQIAALLHHAYPEAARDLGLLDLWRHVQNQQITVAWSGTPPWQGARQRVLTGAEFAPPCTSSAECGLSWRHLRPGDEPIEDLFKAAAPHLAHLSDNGPAQAWHGAIRLSAHVLAQVLGWLGPSALTFLPAQPPGLGEGSAGPWPVPDHVTVPPGTAPTNSVAPLALHLNGIEQAAEALHLTAATPQHGTRRFRLSLHDLSDALAAPECRGALLQAQHLDQQDFYLPDLDVLTTPW